MVRVARVKASRSTPPGRSASTTSRPPPNSTSKHSRPCFAEERFNDAAHTVGDGHRSLLSFKGPDQDTKAWAAAHASSSCVPPTKAAAEPYGSAPRV